MTKLESTLEGLNLKRVCPLAYPGTYAVISPLSIMAQGASNRSSASWKKAEHVFIDAIQPDGGSGLLPYWKEFEASYPDDERRIQKLYVYVGDGRYRQFDADGRLSKEGTIQELFGR